MRGFGSVVKFRTGYRASIYIAGRRHRRLFPKRAQAEQWLKLMAPQRIAGLANVPTGSDEKVTVDELADEALRSLLSRHTYTERTARDYGYQFAQVASDWKGRRVAAIRPRDVDAWVRKLRERGLSTSRVRHLLDRLSQVLRHAEREGYVGRVQVRVERPRLVQRTVIDALTQAEVDALLTAAGADYDRRAVLVVLLAARAGLRVSEIAQLRGEDVGPGYLRVEVRGERADRTKSGHARTVPVEDAELRRALAAWPAKRGERLLGIASGDGLATLIAGAWKGAGLTGPPRLHRLRHTYATTEALAGVPLPVLQQRLGHRTILTTMRYVHAPSESGHTGTARKATHKKQRRVSK